MRFCFVALMVISGVALAGVARAGVAPMGVAPAEAIQDAPRFPVSRTHTTRH
jgi:hypothetical protein